MLSQRIFELRKGKGLSQADLGQELSFTQQTIAKWEKGVAEPNSESIVRLARFFGVTTDYLLGLSDASENRESLPSEKEKGEELNVTEKMLLKSFRSSNIDGKEVILRSALSVSPSPNSANGAEDLEFSRELTKVPLPLRN